MKRILILLSILAQVALAGGRFVAPGISYGTGTGAIGSPQNFQHALFLVSPGDTIYMRAGTYVPDGSAVVEWEVQVSGTRTQRIVITNYPGEKVKLNSLAGRTNGAALNIVGRDFITLLGTGTPDAFQLSNDNETDTASSTQDGLRLTDGSEGQPDSAHILNIFVHNTMSVGLADQGNRGTVIDGSMFMYNGRKSWSNHGYDIYFNRLLGSLPSPSYYRHNFHKDTYSAYINGYTEGGQVDSFQISHSLLMRSFVHIYSLDEMMLFINDTLTGNYIDTNIVIGSYRDLDILCALQKPDLGTKMRGNMFLQGYTQYKDINRWNVTDQYNTYWGSWPQVDNNGGYFNEDTSKAFYENRQWYLTTATPPLADIVRVYANAGEAKRARVYIVQLDSSATVTIPAASLSGIFAADDTLRLYDLQSPGTVWQTTIWDGSSNVTLTMAGIGDPVWPQSVHYHGATTTFDARHMSRQYGAYDVFATGLGVPAENPTISVTPLTLSFTSTTPNPSTSQSVTASGTNLTANITVTAPTDFQVSLNNSTWSGSVTLTQVAGTVNATSVWMRFNRATAGSSSGNVSFTSTGATTRNVAVDGTASDPPPPPPLGGKWLLIK